MKNLYIHHLLFVFLSVQLIFGGINAEAKSEAIGLAVKKNKRNNILRLLSKLETDLTDVSLSQTTSGSYVTTGSNVTFTLTLNNEGQTNISGLEITDILPSELSLLNVSPSIGTTSILNNIITWRIDNFPAFSTPITLNITAKVNSSGVFNNFAEVTAMNETDIDSKPKNNVLVEDDIAIACTSVPYRYCSGAQIEISASATSGYNNYQWYRNGEIIVGATSQSYTITSEGSYTYTADVSVGTSSCTGTLCCPIVVERYPEIVLTGIQTSPSCGNSNGSVSLTATGGTGSYSYSRDGVNYFSTNIFSGLVAGTYNFYVRDGIGCVGNTTVTLVSNDSNISLVATQTSPSCGNSNGSVSLTATGGTGSYSYSRDGINYFSTNVFSGLVAGTYNFYVRDGSGCL
ncbi:hypothetical protein, partial [Emticicia oligotrophica]|uniref:hypothetical protein n=1 Tax=Emticicia oligotrophica TaxID=312279 RepID=UPI0030ED885D